MNQVCFCGFVEHKQVTMQGAAFMVPCCNSDGKELRTQLVAQGFAGGPVRLTSVVVFLLENDIQCVEDFAGAEGFTHLENIADIDAADVEFLRRVDFKRPALPAVAAGPVPLSADARALSMLQSSRSAAQFAVCSTTGVGPGAALKRLRDAGPAADWAEQARVATLLGGCPRSLRSAVSGLRCWLKFAQEMLNTGGLPPTADGLLAWSQLFRCSATFSNYCSYLRLGCELANVSTAALDNRPMLRRARCAIDKRRRFVSREKLFIQLPVVRRLLDLGDKASQWRLHAMLFLTSYVFLLRVPSEALPIVLGGVGSEHGKLQSVIELLPDQIVLHLARRKNRPQGSVLSRKCWCSSCKRTCPIHVLAVFLGQFDAGAQPFANISRGSALAGLKAMMSALRIPKAGSYRTHDFRRGHTKDLAESGSSLAEILRAGEWSSPAFLHYLNVDELEDGAVIEAHLAESSEDE